MKHSRRPTFRLPIEPDDLVRHVLAAYYRATADATAPIACPDPVGWSSPEDFLETIFEYFQLRVRAQAAANGHEIEADTARLLRWESMPGYRDMHFRDVFPEDWAAMVAANPSLAEGAP